MELTTFTQPKDLTGQDLDALESQFQLVLGDPSAGDKVFAALHEFFIARKYSLEIVHTYYYTYWRWYVLLTWSNYRRLSKEDFINALVYQMPLAFSLGLKIEDAFFSYISTTSSGETEWRNTYEDIARKLETVDYALNPTENEVETFQSSAKTFAVKERASNIETSQFVAKMKAVFFGKKEQMYTLADTEEEVTRITSFLHFQNFLMQKRDIAQAMRVYLNGLDEPGRLKEVDIGALLGFDEMEAELEDSSAAPEQAQAPGPYDAIVQQINTDFTQNTEGGFEDVAAVLGRLNELADQVGDESIRELFIFDEKHGDFRWNFELIEGEELTS